MVRPPKSEPALLVNLTSLPAKDASPERIPTPVLAEKSFE